MSTFLRIKKQTKTKSLHLAGGSSIGTERFSVEKCLRGADVMHVAGETRTGTLEPGRGDLMLTGAAFLVCCGARIGCGATSLRSMIRLAQQSGGEAWQTKTGGVNE